MKFDLSGLFSQEKWIPLFALGGQGLQIQLSLAPAAQAAILSDSGTTYSQNYNFTDIRLLAEHVLTGRIFARKLQCRPFEWHFIEDAYKILGMYHKLSTS